MCDRVGDNGTRKQTITVDIPVTVLSTLRDRVPLRDVEHFVRAAVTERLARDPRAG